MDQAKLPEWELLVDEAIREAERKLQSEEELSKRRAVQLAREQAYHRLALAIDRPRHGKVSPSQLSFFPTDPTLFDEEG